MALFARNLYDDDLSFAPVFRFIDAFDNFNRSGRGNQSGGSAFRASFNPKFDVVETKNAYELHGEIPGVDRKDVSIEFTEPQTIVIHGRVERTYSSSSGPESDSASAGAKPVEGAANTEAAQPTSPSSESHRVTVTDEETEAAKERGEEKQQQVATTTNSNTNGRAVQQHNAPKNRFWCQERSIGEFHRTFTFQVPVDEGAVKASLDNGVLHVTIPKLEKRGNRRIDIS